MPGNNNYHLNATASSSATFIEDSRLAANSNNANNRGSAQGGGGYIPEVGKPRSIQSNYDKQRAFNQSQGSNNSSN